MARRGGVSELARVGLLHDSPMRGSLELASSSTQDVGAFHTLSYSTLSAALQLLLSRSE